MNPRDYTDDQAAAVGAAVFHGHVTSRNAAGKYSGVGRAGEPIKEALTAYPYGFRSYAPVNTGLVLTRSQAGLLVLSQENALPSDVTEPLSGEALLYNSTGATVLLDEDGNVILNPTGPGESPPVIKLGEGATKKVALDDDKCPATTKMKTWMGQVESGISGAGGVPPTPMANTFNSTQIATVNATAQKVRGQ